jgi:DNA-binding beta-propeller fold protein YncE
MYVADRINGRVIKISTSGRMQTDAYRTTGSLERPNALTMDAAGNLLVADEARGTVQYFSPGGNQMKSVDTRGKGASMHAGQKNDQSAPAGVAVDSLGNLYVSDQANNQIQKFDNQGQLLKTIGQKGSEPGSFMGPRGLATDAQDNLYVADEYNSRIQKFDASGALVSVSSNKALGTTISQGLGPMSLAVDSKGNIWVAAHTNFSVYKLDPDYGIIVRLETFGRRDGELAGPVTVAVDASDNVYILDRSRRIQKFSPKGNFISKFSFPDAKLGELSAPIGILVDNDNNLFVADDPNFRVQKFDASGRAVLAFGHFGHGSGEFNGVESITMDRHGNLYVADSYNNRVQKFDRSGQFITKWGSYGSQPGEFIRTKVVAADAPRDFIYVNDWHNARVEKFDLDGNFLAEFGNTGPQETRVKGPTGLVVDKEGNVYVSSWFNGVIQKFDAKGKYVMSIGSAGTGDGQFKGPARLAMDHDGNLVVVDWGNSRVQILDTNGNFISKFGSIGRAEGRFNQPVGVAVDQKGNIFISDVANARVQMFSRSVSASGTTPKKYAVEKAKKGSLQHEKEKGKKKAQQRVYGQVMIYDVIPGKAEEFEAAMQATRDQVRVEPSFLNERVLRNVDELTLQYATYTKFTDQGVAERMLRQQAAKVRPFCRRDPEMHAAEVTAAYFPEGITDKPTGTEYGTEMVEQIAHLGLFIPLPQYRRQYEEILHDTKVLTRAKKATGYIGEDVMVETELVPANLQTPYSPHATEPSKMSINYGEYRTMENAEDSYITRQQTQDPKLVTMERTFFSSLQVPTRFYIFQVIDNYNRQDDSKQTTAHKGLK